MNNEVVKRPERGSETAAQAIELLRAHSLATLAQTELERRIISGEIASGTKLNEADVAADLGVSRGPVREAFRALSQAGLVRVEKNRGVFVRQVSLEEASEFYEVRAALEGLIGRLAARRIAMEEIEQLRSVVKRMHQVQKSRKTDEYFALNVEFTTSWCAQRATTHSWPITAAWSINSISTGAPPSLEAWKTFLCPRRSTKTSSTRWRLEMRP